MAQGDPCEAPVGKTTWCGHKSKKADNQNKQSLDQSEAFQHTMSICIVEFKSESKITCRG